MKRITRKRKDFGYELAPGQEIYAEENGVRLVQVVGQCEDAEEELGCHFTNVLKALSEECWIMARHRIKHVLPSEIRLGIKYAGSAKCIESFMCLGIELEGKHYDVKTEDYGKTWALTKEELE